MTVAPAADKMYERLPAALIAVLLLLCSILPWVGAAAGSPSALLIATDSAALTAFGPERIALAWVPLFAPLGGLLAALAALLPPARRTPFLAGAALAAFTAPVVFLVTLTRMSVLATLAADGDPSNDPQLLTLIGFGVWLTFGAAFAAGGLTLRSLQQTARPGSLLDSRRIAISGLLGAIAVTLGVTSLGFIPLPNLTGAATIMHVPAIIGAVLEGPLVGVIAGAIFGLFSMLQDTTGLFNNPLVSVLPRLLIGLTSWLAFRALQRFHRSFAAVVAGAIGSLTNTVGVVGMLIVLGVFPASVFLLVLPQALFEMLLAALLTPMVVAAIDRTRSGRVSADERGPRDQSYF